ncbi:MAG: AbrB/MazE/SpoVT family DNA-binding domain-containing protein [Pseudomonadota bacterium]
MARAQIGKWGRSLAVRLPKHLVEKYDLKEGDGILEEAIERALAESKEARRQEALERIRNAKWKLPPGYKFDRNEIYDEATGIESNS